MVLVTCFMIGFLNEINEPMLGWVSRNGLKRILKRVQHEQTDATTSDIRIPKLSSLCWKQFDKSPSSRQRKFLNPYLQTREPISSYYDIQKGDHLVRTSSAMMGLLKFEHHFLCIGHNERGAPLIVHYNATKKEAFRRFFICSLTHLSLAKVNIMALSEYIDEDNLQKQGFEVKRVLWPDGLRRYSVEKIKRRALIRVGEARYHVTENNCESFIMWCICNSNVSLQATRESIFALKIVSFPSSEEGVAVDMLLTAFTDIIDLLVLLGTFKWPIQVTNFFWATGFCLKYLYSPMGNVGANEKPHQSPLMLLANCVMSLAISAVISHDPGGVRHISSVLFVFFVGRLVGRLTCYLRDY